ncbi:MAG: hypothetical protein F7B59_06695 [Desulfurococcales archaeon]|nr:hypothetical protein [Desulfurococcales archaeon]
METSNQSLVYKAIGVQAVAFAVYMIFTGIYSGIPSINIFGGTVSIGAVIKMSNTGLLLSGLILAFSGVMLFRVSEKKVKVSGSLFIIGGLLAAIAAIIILINNATQNAPATFLLGLFLAFNTMAMPVLGLSILRSLKEEDYVLKYSTALYIVTPIFTVYGLLGLALAGLVATTLIYVESQGLPEQAEKLTETMEKVIPEQ